MTIAVNAVTPAFKPAANSFFQDVFFKIAEVHPQHHFLLVGFAAVSNAPSNCTVLHPGKTIKSPLRFLYWLNYQLPSLLKKNKAAVLFTYNSCSLRMQLPQVLYADDISFLSHPEWYKTLWLFFYKKYTPKFCRKAVHIATASSFLQNEIMEQYKIVSAKLSTVFAVAGNLFKPAVHWNMKEAMKEKLTGGREYFLYTGPIHTNHNLIPLLKAFSFFKQRQKSNMQLVLASTGAAATVFIKSLASYKYRADVVLAENITADELAKITAAAYAVVNPVQKDATGSDVLQALQCAVPVIVSATGVMPEICGDAAVYCDAGDFNDIAAKMMLLFTNEDRRNQQIAKGRDRMQQFSINEPAKQLWQMIKEPEKA